MSEITNFPRESTVREIANAVNMIAISQAGSIMPIESMEAVQQLVRSGLAPKYFDIGDQLVVVRGESTLIFDVLDFDKEIPVDPTKTRSMTVGLHAPDSATQFSAAQANYQVLEEIEAGAANITLRNYDVSEGADIAYDFTVPGGGFVAGGRLRLNNSGTEMLYCATPTAQVVEVPVAPGSANTPLVVAPAANAVLSKQNLAIRVRYGDNNYGRSAVRQRLASDLAKNLWWEPQSIYDLPPSQLSSLDGFMHGMDPEFLAILGKVKKRTALNTVSDGATANAKEEDVGPNDYVDTEELFFLLSRNEVNALKENWIEEGTPYAYYALNGLATSDPVAWRIKYNPAATAWWLRSPSSTHAHNARRVYTDGQINYNYATHSRGVAPACAII